MKLWLAVGLLTLTVIACNKSGSGNTAGTARTDAKYDPCEELRKVNPHCDWKPHWDDSGVSVNAIDGTRTEFLAIDSSDADGLDAGRLHFANLRVCFKNGKLCGGRSVGVAVAVHGIVKPISYEDNYSTSVRLKFDDEKPVSQSWGIADSHDALFPYGKERQFLIQLLRHNRLVLEFSYYEQAPRTVSFELSGLTDKMKSIGVSDY